MSTTVMNTTFLDEYLNKWNLPLTAVFDISTVGTDDGADTGSAPPVNVEIAALIAEQTSSYLRPNGVKYFPRDMTVAANKIHDVTFVKMAYNKSMPVLLFGDPGTGKTALFEAAMPNLVTIQGSVETETADFVGSWTQQTDGTYKWVDGPLPVAMENGWPLLVDEIALIDPRVMAVVYGVMDGRDELVITANPERGKVRKSEGFVVFGSCNPDVPGAIMSDALLSRFQFHVEVHTDWGLTRTLGIDPRIVQVARNLNHKKRDHIVTAAPQLRELLTYRDICDGFGPELALKNFVSQTRPEDREAVVEAIESVFGDKPTAFIL